MKFTPSRNTVISTADTKQFTMAVNAKSFSILTSGIYQNKVKAVIREYSTNALDSHIEANNPEPFEVHLPTEKECYFYVRDYGTGLDEEQFEAVFFKFFESTKDNSNTYNGTMGLGSKSLYSYNTKSFTVESWKNGFHYIYSCFIGPSGVPEYSQLVKEYSQDPEGVKVQASVDRKDIDEFELNAEEVYKYFERKPKFIGKEIELENVYGDNKLYSIRKNINYGDNGSYAVMGNVAYPIEKNYGLDKYSHIINSNLLIFFDIGELTFTPSRESLEYTDYTIKNLKAKFEQVLKSINNEIISKINNAKSEWEAIKLFNSLYLEYKNNVKGLVSPDELKWNGKLLNTKPIEISVEIFDFNRKSKHLNSRMRIGDCNYVIDDLKTGAITRSALLRDSTSKVTFLLKPEDLSNITIQYNDSDFIKASTLPAPTRNIRKRSALSSFSLMKNDTYVTESWQTIDVKDATSKYYIVRKSYNTIYNNRIIKPCDVYHYAINAGITDNIYGVSKTQEEEIIKLGFVNIYDAIIEKTKDIKKELEDNLELIIKLKTYNDFLCRNRDFINNLKKIHKQHDLKQHKLLSLLDLEKDLDSKTLNKFIDKINSFSRIGEDFQVTTNQQLVKDYQEIINKYSMLGTIFPSYYSSKITESHLYHYILGADYDSISRNV
jgi:hypothetical protein